MDGYRSRKGVFLVGSTKTGEGGMADGEKGESKRVFEGIHGNRPYPVRNPPPLALAEEAKSIQLLKPQIVEGSPFMQLLGKRMSSIRPVSV
jgi:hypothetical protein